MTDKNLIYTKNSYEVKRNMNNSVTTLPKDTSSIHGGRRNINGNKYMKRLVDQPY